MKKKLATLALVLGLSVAGSMSAFAGEWKQDNIGWWYQNDDGTYPADTAIYIDGNKDGFAELYHFDANGYMLANTTTPDGFQINENGAVLQPDGEVQLATYSEEHEMWLVWTRPLTPEELAAQEQEQSAKVVPSYDYEKAFDDAISEYNQKQIEEWDKNTNWD